MIDFEVSTQEQGWLVRCKTCAEWIECTDVDDLGWILTEHVGECPRTGKGGKRWWIFGRRRNE